MVDSQRLQLLLRNHWGKLLIAQILVVFSAGYYAASLATRGGTGDTAPDEHAGHTEPAPTRWTCSMHPQIRKFQPGECPLCGMKLIPVTSSAGGGMRTVRISAAARALMNLQTTPVERRYVTTEIRMVGKVDYDETRLAHITAWVSGRLDRLYVDYTGVQVQPGDHMVSIYSEELYAIQDELIRALEFDQRRGAPRTPVRSEIDLVASAREKLRLLGLTDTQIAEIEQREKPTNHTTIHSPIGGVVVEKLKQQGDRVRTGDRIYTVADLNQVWVKLDAYESDLLWLRYGQQVEFTTEAYPGERFTGRIAFIDPILNKETRTVKVRVNVPNADGKLKPEMFVRATVKSDIAAAGRVLSSDLAGKWISPMHPEIVSDKPGNCTICGMPLVRAETLGYVTAHPDETSRPLVIPVSAAMVTGKRAIVYVEQPLADEPTFEGREIVLGPRAGEYYLVRSGLQEGELVVTNGSFKLDSALQIQAKPTMMTPEGGGGGGHDHGAHASGNTPAPEPGTSTSLPAAFQAQLEHVLATFEAVQRANESSRLDAMRQSFRELGTAVRDVDSNLVTGHTAMLWREFSMLLSNDSAEGNDVSRLPEADRVFLLTKRHIQRLRDEFRMKHAEPHGKVPVFHVTTEFQGRLAAIWKAYLPIQEALAADGLQDAQTGLRALSGAVSATKGAAQSEQVGQAWEKEAANLAEILGALKAAQDIETFRSAFALLSDELSAIARSFGFGDATVYELHCPMAFKGRGAIWLQQDSATRNPYFGSVMLRCADRNSRLSTPTASDVAAEAAPGGHAHEH